MIDINRAMELNHVLATAIGWGRHFDQIVGHFDLNFSPDERTFAEAVAQWQEENGLGVDGIIGNNTWEKLSEAMGIVPEPTTGSSGPPSASALDWEGAAPEEIAFMRDVYEAHVKRSSGSRPFVENVPDEALEVIEEGRREELRAPAASSCRRLLAAIRHDLEVAQDEGHADANKVSRIFVSSGYRSVSRQFALWQEYFPSYYRDTEDQRLNSPGGAHSRDAAKLLAVYIGKRIAAPGYSLHNDGLAFDLAARGPNNYSLGASSKQISRWRSSWPYSWLQANSSRFEFHEDPSINEPWHYIYISR